MVNKTGPRQLPCGTSYINLDSSDTVPCTCTFCNLFQGRIETTELLCQSLRIYFRMFSTRFCGQQCWKKHFHWAVITQRLVICPYLTIYLIVKIPDHPEKDIVYTILRPCGGKVFFSMWYLFQLLFSLHCISFINRTFTTYFLKKRCIKWPEILCANQLCLLCTSGWITITFW